MLDFGKPLMWGEADASAGPGGAGRFQLPAGTVTFLLSDIEGSTRLWEQSPEGMAAPVADSYAILGEAVARRGGVRPLEQGEDGYRDYVAWYWVMESWRPLMRGEADRFHELIERALAAVREIGEPVSEATAEIWIAWLEVEQGRAEERSRGPRRSAAE